MHIIDICKQKLHQFRFQGEHNLTVTIVNILSSIWFYVNTPIEHCNKLTRLLSLQGGDLLLEAGILGFLVREMALHLFLHTLDVGDHGFLELLQLRLVVLLDILLVVAQGLDLLPLRGQLLVLHRDEVLERRQFTFQTGRS